MIILIIVGVLAGHVISDKIYEKPIDAIELVKEENEK